MPEDNEAKIVSTFDRLSIVSHYIRMYFDMTLLAHGSCFFVMSDDGPVLITNRHNFTGRNNIDNTPIREDCGIPNHAVVTLHGPPERHYYIDLVDHSDPDKHAWVEHPTLGAKADIVALPVKDLTNDIRKIHSIAHSHISSEHIKHHWDVGTEVQVIGYPYGELGISFPIWSRGSIASEPDVDFANLPMFLIDCRSREGQSGSPVWVRFRRGDVDPTVGKVHQNELVADFLGIYSGRLRRDSDLGFVWKRSCVEELVNHAVSQGTQHLTARRRHRFTATPRQDFSLEQLSKMGSRKCSPDCKAP